MRRKHIQEGPGIEHVEAEQFIEPAKPEAPKASASATFTGDPRGGPDPEAPEYGGMVFPKGKAIPVTAEWLAANGNIRKNNHFKVD